MNLHIARLRSAATIPNLILIGILITSGTLVLRNLGHSGITYWDEGFHAVVARNLTKHPLKFTLYDEPWLPYNYKSWGDNHIWLHKPPVSMWTICLSHFIFGINTFALRLPSAISLLITVWLTFRIASELFDKRAGLIAAFLHAFNPFLFESVHGYRYSDHVDIALLLWVQVSCWLLLRAVRTGKRRNYILSGAAMGIAYLSKSYLALITFGNCVGGVVCPTNALTKRAYGNSTPDSDWRHWHPCSCRESQRRHRGLSTASSATPTNFCGSTNGCWTISTPMSKAGARHGTDRFLTT